MQQALIERHELCATLRASEPDAPTLCGDWTAALLTAHLLQRERSLTESLGRLPVARFRRRAEQRLTEIVASRPYPDLIAAFDAGPPAFSPMALPALREAVNLLEYAVHHEDVRRAAADVLPRDLPTERQQAIWKRLRVSGPFLIRAVPVGVRLVAPGLGTAATRRAKRGGPVVVVTGAPLELALVAFGRQRVARVDYDGAPDDVATVRDARIAI
jgi:uncharacterized protein (TIGR03085 family)